MYPTPYPMKKSNFNLSDFIWPIIIISIIGLAVATAIHSCISKPVTLNATYFRGGSITKCNPYEAVIPIDTNLDHVKYKELYHGDTSSYYIDDLPNNRFNNLYTRSDLCN